MSDIQEKWETYRKFRIKPILNPMDGDPETQNKWVATVDIRLAADGSLVMAGINVDTVIPVNIHATLDRIFFSI